MIEVQNLTKSFGEHLVLKGVDLKINQGEFLILLGANGAGKTTFLKILATLLKPSGGLVRIAGLDITKDGEKIRRLLGVVGHQSYLYPQLTVRENLEFYGRMFGLKNLEKRIKVLGEWLKFETYLEMMVGSLSHGQEKRISIARALLHDPPVLLLDEPESGLDLIAYQQFKELVSNFSDKTIIMTTHNVERCVGLGNRLAVLSDGRLVYQGDHLPDVLSLAKEYLK